MPNLIDHNLLCPHCMHKSAAPQQVCPQCKKDRSTAQNKMEQLPVGAILNEKYLIGSVLGQGGFGITYCAYDLSLDVKMAVKEYYPSNCVSRQGMGQCGVMPYSGEAEAFFKRGREQFFQEARSLAKFTNLDGVIGVRDFFQENGTAYIVMDFAEGVSLKRYMEQNRRGDFAQVLEMMRPLIADLRVIHDQNLIHRDIKPDNIMVSPENKAVLIDFGAARSYMGNQRFSTYSVSVTHGYAPVEQYQNGPQGPWTDVYAMCATLYELATGKQSTSSLERLLNKQPLAKPSELGVSMPRHVEDAIMAGLALMPEQRTQTMHELYDALFKETGSSKAKGKGKEKAPAKEKSAGEKPAGRGAPVWLACLLALALAAVGGLYVMEKLQPAAVTEKKIVYLSTLPQGTQATPWTDGPLDFGGSAELEKALRDACHLPEGDLLPSHAAQAAELKLDGIPMADVSFLHQFTGLTSLSMRETGVTDLSFLEHMPLLKKLDVSGNQVKNLAPLASLPELTWLWAADNRISDLAPLADLTALEVLDVSGNAISDLSPLAGMVKMRRLWIHENEIVSLAPLHAMAELNTLSAGQNQVADLAPLTALQKLETLYLYENQLTDISMLYQLDALRRADVHDNPLTDPESEAALWNYLTLGK